MLCISPLINVEDWSKLCQLMQPLSSANALSGYFAIAIWLMLNFIVPPVQWKDVLGRAKLLLLLLVSETKSNFIIKPIALNQVQIILCLFYMKREGNSSGVAFVWDICLEVVQNPKDVYMFIETLKAFLLFTKLDLQLPK